MTRLTSSSLPPLPLTFTPLPLPVPFSADDDLLTTHATLTAAWYALSTYAMPPSHSTPAMPLHDLHCVLALSSEYVLRGHASHVPLDEYEPSGHAVQLVRCS